MSNEERKGGNKLAGLVVGLLFVIVGGWLVFNGISSVDQSTVTVNGYRIDVDIADTPELQTQGLSGREELTQGRGMLFVYDTPDIRGIWMKDMNFPIDIIWIGEDSTVIEVTADVSPDTYPDTFVSQEPAMYVLEVNAGYAQEIGASEGTRVVLGI